MILVYLFLLHLIADFLLQPREMGRKKSSNMKYLAGHIAIQFGVFAVGLGLFFPPMYAVLYAGLNAVIHGVIDAFIWKGYAWSVWMRRHKFREQRKDEINSMVAKAGGISREPTDVELKKFIKREWKYWEDHWFYVTIGIDQFLHMSTLVLVVLLLM